jgi:hypothetical protein
VISRCSCLVCASRCRRWCADRQCL